MTFLILTKKKWSKVIHGKHKHTPTQQVSRIIELEQKKLGNLNDGPVVSISKTWKSIYFLFSAEGTRA